MSKLIPNVRGPKLFPFDGDLADAQFIKLLNSGDENTSSEGLHGRVFQVLIKENTYAIKVFNFVSLEDLRPPVLTDEHLISDNVIRHHLDPFFAECRAFGRLTKERKDHELAIRCHGYVFLSMSVERRIEEQFGVLDWNRAPEDNNQPLRAIVKNYIRYKSFYKPSKFRIMKDRLKQLNDMGIYNMDIRKENYLGGHLFDFSTAITTPHLSFSLGLRTQAQIMEDIHYDLECFDSMVKPLVEQIELHKTSHLENHRSSSKKKDSSQENKSTEEEPRTRLRSQSKKVPIKDNSQIAKCG
ncbi:kinetochore Sim4 complex subunit FTA2-domain-containing protein [Xylariaceae sp. AK1471]|nr:kinetochore Sim4 complex subunit FTA2-domain-containing protein [Xylariaceae sp. AK1471]